MVSDLFAEAIVPEQFDHAPRWTRQQHLMFRVLEEAARDCRTYRRLLHTKRGKRLYQETADWILRQDEAWPFSFVNICDALGVDVRWLRRVLLAGDG